LEFIETKTEPMNIELFLNELITLINSIKNNNLNSIDNSNTNQTINTFLENAQLLKNNLMNEIKLFNLKNQDNKKNFDLIIKAIHSGKQKCDIMEKKLIEINENMEKTQKDNDIKLNEMIQMNENMVKTLKENDIKVNEMMQLIENKAINKNMKNLRNII